MNREQMVSAAAEVMWDNNPEEVDTMTTARLVLDAVLPQVSTVAELEALPVGALVVASDGESWKLESGEWWEHSRLVAASASYLATLTPLTVVWQP